MKDYALCVPQLITLNTQKNNNQISIRNQNIKYCFKINGNVLYRPLSVWMRIFFFFFSCRGAKSTIRNNLIYEISSNELSLRKGRSMFSDRLNLRQNVRRFKKLVST